MYEPGPGADARRAHALPLIAQDPTRAPDVMMSGPDVETSQRLRQDGRVRDAGSVYYSPCPGSPGSCLPRQDLTIGVANASMVMTYDQRRLVKRAGRISPETQRALDQALGIHLGLVPI